MLSYIMAVASGLLLLAADQFTKYIVMQNMALHDTAKFLPGFMNFLYIHNEGGAWGFLEGHTWILLVVTIIIMIICVIMVIKIDKNSKLLFWAVCLILSGGFGNMIDRVFRNGKVIDFLNFLFIDFPVFNVADCGVVIGAGLLILYFILDMIREKNEKKEEV